MELDIRTLAFVTTLFSVLFALGLITVFWAQRHAGIAGVGMAALACSSIALGFFLLGLRHLIPHVFSILLANGLLFLGGHFLLEMAVRLANIEPLRWRYAGLTLIGVGLVLFAYFTYGNENVVARIVVISLALGAFTAIAAWLLWQHGGDLAQRCLASILVLFAAFMLLRVIWTLAGEGIQDFMSAGLMQALAFLTMISLVAGVSFTVVWVVSSRLQKKLNQLERVDVLTGTLHRAVIQQITERLIEQRNRTALVYCDINSFAELNLVYGNATGDAVLAKVGQTLSNCLQASEYIGRLGDDKFLVVLPNASETQAQLRAQQLQQAIVAMNYHAGSQPVSVSIRAALLIVTEKHSWPQLIMRLEEASRLHKQAERAQSQVQWVEMDEVKGAT
ncbi:GGDEF domain-containing protein [Balneatrix alpica]|uniref:GGDEF domain-containing protein n=1 Tax=Balneatrix alpica TaxID=75684 RepID=UPI002738BB07|nr:GGDEF domain-containing protein [Balneatrix alpica]